MILNSFIRTSSGFQLQGLFSPSILTMHWYCTTCCFYWFIVLFMQLIKSLSTWRKCKQLYNLAFVSNLSGYESMQSPSMLCINALSALFCKPPRVKTATKWFNINVGKCDNHVFGKDKTWYHNRYKIWKTQEQTNAVTLF